MDWSPIATKSAIWLDRLVLEEEVYNAVFELDKEKTLWLDGFSIVVFQERWDVIKEDLLRLFSEFDSNGVINQSVNATFIALVPKKRQTTKVLDFKPIRWVTSLDKIISKVLSR